MEKSMTYRELLQILRTWEEENPSLLGAEVGVELRDNPSSSSGAYTWIESLEREGSMTTNPVFVVDYRKI